MKIDISYAEYEEGEGFVARGCYTLEVLLFDNDIAITQTYEACDKFNKENFIGWEFGSEEDWNKQFGNNCAFTSAKKKRKNSQLRKLNENGRI